MTTEEKAKAYDEALEKIREGLHPLPDGAKISGVTRAFLEEVFPELAESEDEKIRNRILLSLEKDLMATKNSGCDTQDLEQCIAWLEKQGKSITIDIDKMVLKYSQTRETCTNGLPVNCQIRAYRQGINDALRLSLNPEKQEPIDENKLAKGVLRGIATSIMKWLDANVVEGNMCLSNMECEDIENAVRNADWMKVYQYMKKKLEKQGVQKPFDYENANIQQKDFASVGETATIELSSPIDCGDRIYHVSHKPIEKQGEQKVSVADFKAKDWYVSKVDGKIHDMTYNPADKVESKFKVGDWVVDNRTGVIHYIANIKGTVNGCYYVFGNDKGLLHIDNEEDYHIWTIQDAKDGDVLVDKYGNIGIYQGDKNALRWNSYCYCGVNKVFYDEGSHEFPCYPATKEQQDTLEKAMADAGYTFDFEKKELKKPQRMISAEAKEALYDKVEPKFNIGDVLCDKSCTTLDKNSQPNIEILDIRNDMYICNNCSFPISQQDEYELVAKRIVPQSAAWSDEDEKMANDLIEGCLSSEKAYHLVHTSKEIADWLKSIKDRM